MKKFLHSKTRPDFDVISNLVTLKSSVLDLGCGDGSLIKHLKEKKDIFGYGIENDLSKIDYCLKNKISVIHKDIETGIQDFEDKSFDFVILSLTLQSVKNTYNILNEMLRVGKIGIVTFPNFGFGNIAYKLCWEQCLFPLRCLINGSIPLTFIYAQ